MEQIDAPCKSISLPASHYRPRYTTLCRGHDAGHSDGSLIAEPLWRGSGAVWCHWTVPQFLHDPSKCHTLGYADTSYWFAGIFAPHSRGHNSIAIGPSPPLFRNFPPAKS
jgi:hypothetical protein